MRKVERALLAAALMAGVLASAACGSSPTGPDEPSAPKVQGWQIVDAGYGSTAGALEEADRQWAMLSACSGLAPTVEGVALYLEPFTTSTTADGHSTTATLDRLVNGSKVGGWYSDDKVHVIGDLAWSWGWKHEMLHWALERETGSLDSEHHSPLFELCTRS